MTEPKAKPAKREAGKSKFRLPERAPRPAEENPLRALLEEARAQEQALGAKARPKRDTPARKNTGVSKVAPLKVADTPAIRGAGVGEFEAAAPPGQPAGQPFEEFSRRWSPILRGGQMGVCRALFEMTYALGRADCFTSVPRLAEAAGIKERHCYNVITQLELLGFIERPDVFNTPTHKGTIFRLHLEPLPPAARVERRYHIGREKED